MEPINYSKVAGVAATGAAIGFTISYFAKLSTKGKVLATLGGAALSVGIAALIKTDDDTDSEFLGFKKRKSWLFKRGTPNTRAATASSTTYRPSPKQTGWRKQNIHGGEPTPSSYYTIGASTYASVPTGN